MIKLKTIIDKYLFSQPINKIKINSRKLTINTINAHSFCIAKKYPLFADSLVNCDVLLPDGISIVYAAKLLNKLHIDKIAGADLHNYLLRQANLTGEKVFYLGSTESTLNLIENKIKSEFPNIELQKYSPPFKPYFDADETGAMINAVNAFEPKILFVGMTAPKQEKWVYENKERLNAQVIACIGAVFDFYAGNINRAPSWMIKMGLEWLHRLISEPRRLWKRYLINNTKFMGYVLQEYISNMKKNHTYN